jgi:hypothetical protein
MTREDKIGMKSSVPGNSRGAFFTHCIFEAVMIHGLGTENCARKRILMASSCYCLIMRQRYDIEGSKSSYLRVFSLDVQAFSFILHLPVEAFPFVFCRLLEPVDPYFEDGYEGFLPDFVENVGDRAF